MIDLSKYLFSIIYSVDLPMDARLDNGYRPPNFHKNGWQVTEHGPSEFNFKPKWKHRKYCALLNFQQFCDFLNHVDMSVEKTQTLGSIGAPGFFPFATPAVPFRSNDDMAVQCAYVTPCPPEIFTDEPEPDPLLPGMPEDILVPDFEIIEKAMWEWFENGGYSAQDMVGELQNAFN